jgi:hypothetical protein
MSDNLRLHLKEYKLKKVNFRVSRNLRLDTKVEPLSEGGGLTKNTSRSRAKQNQNCSHYLLV